MNKKCFCNSVNYCNNMVLENWTNTAGYTSTQNKVTTTVQTTWLT